MKTPPTTAKSMVAGKLARRLLEEQYGEEVQILHVEPARRSKTDEEVIAFTPRSPHHPTNRNGNSA